jgi:Rho family protein
VESKWLPEIQEHCAGAKIVLVALKCDLREEGPEEKDGNDDEPQAEPRTIITYTQGLEVARRIGALRYLGMALKYVSTYPVCCAPFLT